MNGCPYNLPSFNYTPRAVVPRRATSSGVSLTTFIIFTLLMVFLMSEVYNYARKVCLDHQRHMRAMCVSHQVALDAKLQRICSAHKKCLENRLEEIRCKCHCECEEEKEKENCCEDEDEVEDEEVETDGHVLAPIPEEPEEFSGFKID